MEIRSLEIDIRCLMNFTSFALLLLIALHHEIKNTKD
jgi:hypothetical protein